MFLNFLTIQFLAILIFLTTDVYNHIFSIIPKNKFTFEFKRLTLECALDSKDPIYWYLKNPELKEVLISKGNRVEAKYRRDYNISIVNKVDFVIYQLIILNVTLAHAGIYSCYDFYTETETAASLTVVKTNDCAKFRSSIFCVYISRGPYSLIGNYSIDIVTKEFKQNYYFPFGGNLYRSTTFVTNYTFVRSFSLNSYLEIMTNENITVEYSKYPKVDPIPPKFFIKLFPVKNALFNIFSYYNFLVPSLIKVSATSTIPINYNCKITPPIPIIDHLANNLFHFKTPGIKYSIKCKVENSLNTQPVVVNLKDVKGVETDESFVETNIYCVERSLQECIFSLSITEVLFKNLQEREEDMCLDNKLNLMCFIEHTPCSYRLDKVQIISAVELYCKEKNKDFTLGDDFSETFLHSIPQIFLFNFSRDNPFEINTPFYKSKGFRVSIIAEYCSRMLDYIYVYQYESYFTFIKSSEKGRTIFNILSELKKFDKAFYNTDLGQMDYNKCSNYLTDLREMCELVRDCWNYHASFIRSFKFGFFYIENLDSFYTHVCNVKFSFTFKCWSELLSKCNNFTEAIVLPFENLKDIFCVNEYSNAYNLFYDICYKNVFTTSGSDIDIDLTQCSIAMDKSFKGIRHELNAIAKENIVCKIVYETLDCLYDYISGKCKHREASDMQIDLARMAFSVSLRGIHCKDVFFRNSYDIFKNELNFSDSIFSHGFILNLFLILVYF